MERCCRLKDGGIVHLVSLFTRTESQNMILFLRSMKFRNRISKGTPPYLFRVGPKQLAPYRNNRKSPFHQKAIVFLFSFYFKVAGDLCSVVVYDNCTNPEYQHYEATVTNVKVRKRGLLDLYYDTQPYICQDLEVTTGICCNDNEHIAVS
jgi:hypothetical protein